MDDYISSTMALVYGLDFTVISLVSKLPHHEYLMAVVFR